MATVLDVLSGPAGVPQGAAGTPPAEDYASVMGGYRDRISSILQQSQPGGWDIARALARSINPATPSFGQNVQDITTARMAPQLKALELEMGIHEKIMVHAEEAAARGDAQAEDLKTLVSTYSIEKLPPGAQQQFWQNVEDDPDDISDDSNKNRRIFQRAFTGLDPDTLADEMETTPAMKNALALGYEEGTPEYNDYILKATVDRPPLINMAETLQLAQGKAMIELDLEQFKAEASEVERGEALQPRLQSMALLLEGNPDLTTGPVTEALMPFRQALAEMGWSADPNLSALEQIQSGMAYLVPRMRVVGSGTTTDRDMEFFRKAAPNMKNTRESNVVLARTMMQIQERNRDALEMGRAYYGEHGTRVGMNDFIEQELGPLFPHPRGQEDVDEYEPGTVFFWDGRFLVKSSEAAE